MTAKEYFNSVSFEDSPIDIFQISYSRSDLFKFAESYAKEAIKKAWDRGYAAAINENSHNLTHNK